MTVQFLCLKQQWKVGSLVFIAVSFCAADYSKKTPPKKDPKLEQELGKVHRQSADDTHISRLTW